jgi:diacylglycerol kinase (ATP)
MRYGIVINPTAGTTSRSTKRKLIKQALHVFGPETPVVGWDSKSPEQLRGAARDLAGKVDVLVVAGGDGTFSDVLNAVDPSTVLSFIPLGSGNAWQKTLGLSGTPRDIATTIRNGRERAIDLILCDGRKKGIFASIGLEGHVLKERKKQLSRGIMGFSAYARATATSLFLRGYERKDATLTLDGEVSEVRGITTLVVSKTEYYGYAFRVVPQARPDDGYLHILVVRTGLIGTLAAIATSFLGGNRMGDYRTAENLTVRLQQDAYLQVDGNLEREGRDFKFEVLPRALRVRT